MIHKGNVQLVLFSHTQSLPPPTLHATKLLLGCPVGGLWEGRNGAVQSRANRHRLPRQPTHILCNCNNGCNLGVVRSNHLADREGFDQKGLHQLQNSLNIPEWLGTSDIFEVHV